MKIAMKNLDVFGLISSFVRDISPAWLSGSEQGHSSLLELSMSSYSNYDMNDNIYDSYLNFRLK